MTKDCRPIARCGYVQGSWCAVALGCLFVWGIAETRAQQQASPVSGRAVLLPPRTANSMPDAPAMRVSHVTAQRTDVYPIDLPTALRLAGANNLQITRAAARIDEARARLAGSQAAWWPSLYGGAGYTRHNGQIQDTRGQVIEVTRSSVFVGGGPALGNTISGGAGSPRLGMDFSLTDALFGPLVQRQLVQAANATYGATYNDTLLQVSLGYLDLIRAQGQTSIAQEAVKNAQSLADLVGNRVKAKTAPPADGLRVQAELADRRRQLFQAEESVRVVSAELVRLLRLDPTTVLMPAEEQALPLSFVNENASLAALIDQGVASRPEVAERQAVANATAQRWRQEQWRPLIPSVHVGLSAGGFGGGDNAFLGNFRDRADFDALLVWPLQNLGFGNRALRRERAAQTQQATLATAEVRDLVAAEVVAAYYQVHFRKKQLDAARDQVQAAEKALPLNFLGIKGEVLRAIEAQQAIHTLASARSQYLSVITDYNRAQLLLVRAVGGSIPGHAADVIDPLRAWAPRPR